MKQPAVIIDVNGTLGDTSKRQHFLDREPRDWEGFFSHMIIDKPVDIVHRFVNAQRDHPFFCKILMVTGAPEKYRYLMEKWLEQNEVEYDDLYMRGDYQYIKGYVFKQKLITEKLNHKYDIVLAMDDKQECAEMYRELGIPCWVTAECTYPRRQEISTPSQSKPRVRNRGRIPRPR